MAEPERMNQQVGQQRLQQFIAQHHIDADIITPGADTPTVPAAAEALGVRPEQIVKSLVFHGRDDNIVVAIIRGTAKVDRRKLSQAAGLRKPRLAPPDVVHEKTGFQAGGTPPVGHRCRMTVYMDDAVFDEPVVYGGGGDVDTLLRITPDTIRKFTDAIVTDISEDE